MDENEVTHLFWSRKQEASLSGRMNLGTLRRSELQPEFSYVNGVRVQISARIDTPAGAPIPEHPWSDSVYLGIEDYNTELAEDVTIVMEDL